MEVRVVVLLVGGPRRVVLVVGWLLVVVAQSLRFVDRLVGWTVAERVALVVLEAVAAGWGVCGAGRGPCQPSVEEPTPWACPESPWKMRNKQSRPMLMDECRFIQSFLPHIRDVRGGCRG